jgi:glycine/D-amino acid oxidase-like deaminating enzyme
VVIGSLHLGEGQYDTLEPTDREKSDIVRRVRQLVRAANVAVDEKGNRIMEEAVPLEIFSDLERTAEPYSAPRDVGRDGTPAIERDAEFPNVIHVRSFGGAGVTLAPGAAAHDVVPMVRQISRELVGAMPSAPVLE